MIKIHVECPQLVDNLNQVTQNIGKESNTEEENEAHATPLNRVLWAIITKAYCRECREGEVHELDDSVLEAVIEDIEIGDEVVINFEDVGSIDECVIGHTSEEADVNDCHHQF